MKNMDTGRGGYVPLPRARALRNEEVVAAVKQCALIVAHNNGTSEDLQEILIVSGLAEELRCRPLVI